MSSAYGHIPLQPHPVLPPKVSNVEFGQYLDVVGTFCFDRKIIIIHMNNKEVQRELRTKRNFVNCKF